MRTTSCRSCAKSSARANDFARKITYRTGTARVVNKNKTEDGSEVEEVTWVNTGAKPYFRGDWSVPKTDASAATIGVDPQVIARLLRLATLTVEVRAGRAVRKHKLVKSRGPDDLVFQSVRTGKPMNDQNVLKRHVKAAARELGLPFVNWRCLRTSHATWLVQAGADPKSVQGQMRHSRISTTMEIYAQIVPSAQRRALQQLSAFAGSGVPAEQQMAPRNLDFSESEDPRSNSRSKTFQIN